MIERFGPFGDHPTLKAEIFALLEAGILAGKQATGRPGMDLWPILVLGVVRLGFDADWDRLEDLANHLLVRQMLGVPATPLGQDATASDILTCSGKGNDVCGRKMSPSFA